MLRFMKTADREELFELNKSEPGAVLTSKNHMAGLDGSEDHSDGKIFALATSRRCPVEILKLYLSHLNPNSKAKRSQLSKVKSHNRRHLVRTTTTRTEYLGKYAAKDDRKSGNCPLSNKPFLESDDSHSLVCKKY